MKATKMRNNQIYRASLGTRSKQLGSPLSKDLQKKYGKRNVRVVEGDTVKVVVKKGPAELRKQVHGAVIVRQKYPVRRLNGVRVAFEDNAAVLTTPEGEMKGTDIKGPVAAEASEKWPRVADLASMVV